MRRPRVLVVILLVAASLGATGCDRPRLAGLPRVGVGLARPKLADANRRELGLRVRWQAGKGRPVSSRAFYVGTSTR